MKVLRLGFAASLLLSGCLPQIAPTNPYDPETPADLQQKATLSGAVADASGPLEGAVLTLAGPTTPVTNPFSTDADGGFNFGELTPGVYSLSIEHPSHFAAFRDLILQAGETRSLAIELVTLVGDAGSGHLTGIAQKSGELVLATALQDHSGITVEVTGAGIRTVTNRDGRFDLFLNDGVYDVTFDAPEYERATRTGVVVIAGETTDLPSSPVVLSPNPGAVVGVAHLEGKDPQQPLHDGILVSVLGTSATTQTAADGSYRLDGLAAGTYTVVASKAAASVTYATASSVVVVKGGQTTTAQDITLAIARGRVTGTVTIQGESDASGVTVALVGTTYTAISNAAGDWAIEGVPVGSYDVEARKQSYSPASESNITVETGATTTVSTALVLVKETGDFLINGGDQYATDPLVTLTLDVTGAFEMMISEDPTFSDASLGDISYRTYDPAPGFQLSGGGLPAGDGDKTVYVQTRDSGLVVQGVLSASIILDTVPPQNVTVVINDGDDYTNDNLGIVTLTISATDATSGVRSHQATNDNVFTAAGWVPYSTSITHVLGTPGVEESKTVYLKVRDWAGNAIVTSVTDTIKLDKTKPVIGTFTLSCPGAFVADKCNTPVVGLTIAGTDGPVGVGQLSFMALANEGGFSGTAFESYATSRSWLLTPGDGAKTVSLLLMDAAGNVSTQSNIPLTLDATAPTAVSVTVNGVLDNDGGASTASLVSTTYTNTASVSLTLSASDGSGTGLAKSWVANDPSFVGATFGNYATAVNPWTLSPTTGETLTTVYVRVADQAGNITASSGSIFLDTVDPLPGFALDSAYTTGASANAVLTASGASEMCFWGTGITGGSSDSCVDNGWETYNTSKTLTLSSGNGTKSVRARFRDGARNRTTNAPAARTIVRDDVAPTNGTATIHGLAASGSSTTITRVPNVAIDIAGASDATSGITQMEVSEDSGFAGAAWQAYATNFSWVLSSGDGTKNVYIALRDAAGNSSGFMTGTIVLDQTAPTGGTFSLDDTQDSDDDYTKITAVNASLSASGAASVCFLGPVTVASNDGCTSNGWSAYATSVPLTLTGSDGSKSIIAFFRDTAGNVTSQLVDAIYLDQTAPTRPGVASVSPKTTSVFIDLDESADAGSGVTSYRVYYASITDGQHCDQNLPAAQYATFTSGEGWIQNLSAPKVYSFCPVAYDRAGNPSHALPAVWDGSIPFADSLVGMNISLVDALGRVATFGDRVLSARGYALFPNVRNGSQVELVSCDARSGRCRDAGFSLSPLDLTITGAPTGPSQWCQTSMTGGVADTAITQQGLDTWLFALCPASASSYRTVVLRSPLDASDIPDLNIVTSGGPDAGSWRLLDLGVTGTAGNFGKSASAAANGNVIALSYIENVSSGGNLRVKLCRVTDDCTQGASWKSVSPGVSGSDVPASYTALEAGPRRLWAPYWRAGASPATVDVDLWRCDTSVSSPATATCENSAGWSSVVLPNTSVQQVHSVRIVEVRGTLYVAALETLTAGGPGVFLWRCTASTGCDAAGELGSRIPISQTLGNAVSSGTNAPRLAFEYADGYLYYGAVDYLTGDVYYARCRETTGCDDISEWTPSAVFSTPTVNGQLDLAVIAGNPTLFLNRDPNNVYVLEPNTPAPFGRALVPDFEVGGVRASVTPRDPTTVDGYVAAYNTSGYGQPFSESVISFEPASEGFSVDATSSTVYGYVAAVNGNDASFANPDFTAKGPAPISVSATTSMAYPVYADHSTCHVLGYVDGLNVVVRGCLRSGSCSSLAASYNALTLPSNSTVSGLALTTDGNNLHVVVTGAMSGTNHNVRWTVASLDAATCVASAAATGVDLYASSLSVDPALPSVLSTGGWTYIAYGDDAGLPAIARCKTSGTCTTAASWNKETFASKRYRGGDLVAVGSRLFWLDDAADTPPAVPPAPNVLHVKRCDLTTSPNPCIPGSFTSDASDVQIKTYLEGPTDARVQGGRLLVSQGGTLYSCVLTDPVNDCVAKTAWEVFSTSGETLAFMNPVAGIPGVISGDLTFLGYAAGGLSLQRCADHCWDSDQWFGGFVGRSAQFGATLWNATAPVYQPTGGMGMFEDSGELFAAYRFVGNGEPPGAPKTLRVNDGALLDVKLAP